MVHTMSTQADCCFRYFIYWCFIMSNTTYELVASLKSDRLKVACDITHVIFRSYDRDIERSYETLRNPYLQAHHASLAAERKARVMRLCGYHSDVAEAYRDAAWHAVGRSTKPIRRCESYERILAARAKEYIALAQEIEARE